MNFNRRKNPDRPKSVGEFSCVLKLTVPQLVVKAFLGKQTVMVAHFHNVAVLHNKNQVGTSDGGKTVGNDEGGLALHQLPEGIVDL